jgi:hypothetical protein
LHGECRVRFDLAQPFRSSGTRDTLSADASGFGRDTTSSGSRSGCPEFRLLCAIGTDGRLDVRPVDLASRSLPDTSRGSASPVPLLSRAFNPSVVPSQASLRRPVSQGCAGHGNRLVRNRPCVRQLFTLASPGLASRSTPETSDEIC